MFNISTRIDTLNKQLQIISKLQTMEDYSICPRATCKINHMYNNFGKLCHCAHQVLSLEEQSNSLGHTEQFMSYNNSKRRLPCNSVTCKARRKLHLKNPPLSEVEQDLSHNLKVSRSANANIKGDSMSNASPKKQNKSDQVNLTSELYKMYTHDKIIDTYEEKGEQTIPTKDNYYVELSVQNSNTNHVQQEAFSKDKAKNEVDKSTQSELEELYHITEDVYIKNKEDFERVEKDLLTEKQRTLDLEQKLKSLTCSLNCLKEDSEQKAACLKGVLETAEKQTKVAMDLAKQSTDQVELVKADEEKLLNVIAKLQQQVAELANTNRSLLQECDCLKNKLQSLSEDESKKCEEVEKEVSRMKHAVKEKETALSKERAEFMGMILELTNVIDIQKRRICEVTGICSNQQRTIQETNTELSQKTTELSEMKSMFQASNFSLKEMEEKVHNLEYCLCQETKNCDCLKQELQTLKENHSTEQRIKEKIIDDQNKTIAKQKKLLHESREMAQDLASEFYQLKDQLHIEKQKSKSLQLTLDETNCKLSTTYQSDCGKCRILLADIDYLNKEKQRAIAIAKFASQKLHQTVKQYQNKLICSQQQHRYMTLIIKKKEQEIMCLKRQISQSNRRMS